MSGSGTQPGPGNGDRRDVGALLPHQQWQRGGRQRALPGDGSPVSLIRPPTPTVVLHSLQFS